MTILTRRNTIGILLAATIAKPALAQSPPVYAEGGKAIDGTDTVAYFTRGRAVAGAQSHTVIWNGSMWLFSSAENKAMFEADPEKYAPKYGGYCAWAMSRGYVAPTAPEAWSIVDGKLYLNYSLDIRERWSRDVHTNIARADAFWPKPLEN
ncbi:MAG: YHS domain-containing protein [Rhodobacteraceae bacterium]|nr:YHS domain-containing protein [Paracoccaceae bacterium]